MQQEKTKLATPLPWRRAPDREKSYLSYEHQGIKYLMVPEDVIREFEANRANLIALLAGLAFLTLAALFSAFVSANKPETIVEKPIVLTQEKVVPTNCLIFCGGK